jgi:hypothetical protein
MMTPRDVIVNTEFSSRVIEGNTCVGSSTQRVTPELADAILVNLSLAGYEIIKSEAK